MKLINNELDNEYMQQNYSDLLAFYFGRKRITYEKLCNDVDSVVEQISRSNIDKDSILLLFMTNPYVLITTILAANKLQYSILPYFEKYVPGIECSNDSYRIVILADEKNGAMLTDAFVPYIQIEDPYTLEIEQPSSLPYHSEMVFFEYELNVNKRVSIIEEDSKCDLKLFADRTEINRGTKICINNRKNAEIFLSEIFTGIMKGATLYDFGSDVEYHSVRFFQRIAENDIDIINLSEVTIWLMSKFDVDSQEQMKETIDLVKHTILVGDRKSEIIDAFMNEYDTDILFYNGPPMNILRLGMDTYFTSEEQYIAELIILSLNEIVKDNLTSINMNDSLEDWGVTSLNFVQVLVNVEGILDIELDDDIFSMIQHSNMKKLVQKVTENWRLLNETKE